MMGALFNGITGLTSFERAISVEGNNVSNTTTIGHKEDQVRFEDMIYNRGYGKGVGIQTIQKNFLQGDVQITNVNLDVAIEGKGFFIVSERGTGDIFYSRAGNFKQAADGLLETQEGFKVLGLSPQQQNIVSTDANDTSFTNDFSQFITSIDLSNNETVYNFNAKTTDYNSSAVDDTTSGDNSKTASSKINDVDLLKNDYINKLKLLQSNFTTTSTPSTTQISQINFQSHLSDLQNENDFLQITFDGTQYRQYFDTDIETTLKNLSDKISNTKGFTSSVDTNSGILTIENLIPGKSFNLFEANINEQYIAIEKMQEAVLGSGMEMINSSREALKKAVENADAKYLEIENVLSYSDKSVIGQDEINLKLRNLGLVENELGTISITDDGLVYVKSDENNFLISKIQTAHFRNEQGLYAKGSNTYQETESSGNPLNADSLNTLVSNSIETGNSKYNNSLSKLLFYQKAFEANSKSITVSDEFLQTAIEMKK